MEMFPQAISHWIYIFKILLFVLIFPINKKNVTASGSHCFQTLFSAMESDLDEAGQGVNTSVQAGQGGSLAK